MEQKQGKLRVRVCGICVQKGKMLLVKQVGLPHVPYLWIPAGGGVAFGETLEQALTREFLEETGVSIQVGNLLFVHQFIRPPLHAIEFFFEVIPPLQHSVQEYYPENEPDIQEVKWLSFDELNHISTEHKHQFLHHIHSEADLKNIALLFTTQHSI